MTEPSTVQVFAFLQSSDYNPLTPDQTKQVKEVSFLWRESAHAHERDYAPTAALL